MFRQSIVRSRPPLLAPYFKEQCPANHFNLSNCLQPRHTTCLRTLPQSRPFTSFNERKPSKPPSSTPEPGKPYIGPLALTFQRLKIFSISSFSASCALAPFMFVVESNLPMSARISLASIAVGTSGISTALVGWCGQPYAVTLRYLTPEESGGVEGIEMTTQTLLLSPRATRVYDTAFLVETKRPFAKWELADTVVLPEDKNVEPGNEETVAETMDKDGNVLGRWIVRWGAGGVGKCHEVGKVVRYFNVHEELL